MFGVNFFEIVDCCEWFWCFVGDVENEFDGFFVVVSYGLVLFCFVGWEVYFLFVCNCCGIVLVLFVIIFFGFDYVFEFGFVCFDVGV